MEKKRLLTEDQIGEIGALADFRVKQPSIIWTSSSIALQYGLWALFPEIWHQVDKEHGDICTKMSTGDDSLIPQFFAILRGEVSND